LILELNARPGLNIQIANRRGLRHRLDAVDAHMAGLNGAVETPAQRAQWSRDNLGEPASKVQLAS
jgi:hypothetical protein